MSLEKAWSDGEREQGVANCGLGGQVNAFPVHVSGCCTQRERGVSLSEVGSPHGPIQPRKMVRNEISSSPSTCVSGKG